jgi:hypothetical protein
VLLTFFQLHGVSVFVSVSILLIMFGMHCFQFKEISFAYDVLSNPEKKEIYDRHGIQGLREGGGGGGKHITFFKIVFLCCVIIPGTALLKCDSCLTYFCISTDIKSC